MAGRVTRKMIHELRPHDEAQLGSFAVLKINLDIRAVKVGNNVPFLNVISYCTGH
jgi:hypothetical protein